MNEETNSFDNLKEDVQSPLEPILTESNEATTEITESTTTNLSEVTSATEVSTLTSNSKTIFETFLNILKNPVTSTVRSGRENNKTQFYILGANLIILFVWFYSSISAATRTITKDLGNMLDYMNISTSSINFNLSIKFFMTSVLSYAIFIASLYFLYKLFKKVVDFNNIINMISTATIPSSAILLVSIPLIWINLGFIALSFLAIISFIMLSYMGMQKITKFETSPYWAYMLVVSILLVLFSLICYKLVGGAILEIIELATSNIFNIFGF